MKQAILITAFKNFNQLAEIAEFFDEDFSVYVHIDKKSKISSEELTKLNAIPNIALISQKFKVNWGGRNHLRCILFLISEALKDKDIQYFHLITGQDFPIKSKETFKEFFQKNKEKDFLEHFTMPAACWNHGGMDRIEHYNLYDALDAKKSLSAILKLLKIQKRFGLKRSLSKKLPQLYGGSTYWSLSRPTINYINEYNQQQPALLSRLKHTFCAEEIYMQTVVMNSEFKDRAVSNNLRFILWEEKNGSNPGVLDDADFNAITQSDAFFARKFDRPVSESLLHKLKKTYSKK